MEYQWILGSASPRRKQLLQDFGLSFEVRVADIDESAPSHFNGPQTVEHIAHQKALSLRSSLGPNEILITSDTEVWFENQRLGKPADLDQAKKMISALSGNTHEVISGICLMTQTEHWVEHEITEVTFAKLTPAEIDYYVENYKPLDKAGAYGIQEWIGMVGIKSIKGSYFNVVGLPTFTLQKMIKRIKNK